jgi:hypothetical protein
MNSYLDKLPDLLFLMTFGDYLSANSWKQLSFCCKGLHKLSLRYNKLSLRYKKKKRRKLLRHVFSRLRFPTLEIYARKIIEIEYNGFMSGYLVKYREACYPRFLDLNNSVKYNGEVDSIDDYYDYPVACGGIFEGSENQPVMCHASWLFIRFTEINQEYFCLDIDEPKSWKHLNRQLQFCEFFKRCRYCFLGYPNPDQFQEYVAKTFGVEIYDYDWSIENAIQGLHQKHINKAASKLENLLKRKSTEWKEYKEWRLYHLSKNRLIIKKRFRQFFRYLLKKDRKDRLLKLEDTAQVKADQQCLRDLLEKSVIWRSRSVFNRWRIKDQYEKQYLKWLTEDHCYMHYTEQFHCKCSSTISSYHAYNCYAVGCEDDNCQRFHGKIEIMRKPDFLALEQKFLKNVCFIDQRSKRHAGRCNCDGKCRRNCWANPCSYGDKCRKQHLEKIPRQAYHLLMQKFQQEFKAGFNKGKAGFNKDKARFNKDKAGSNKRNGKSKRGRR